MRPRLASARETPASRSTSPRTCCSTATGPQNFAQGLRRFRAHLGVGSQLRAQAERAAPVGKCAQVTRVALCDRAEALPRRHQRRLRLAAQRRARSRHARGLRGGESARGCLAQQLQAALFQQPVRQQRVTPVALGAIPGGMMSARVWGPGGTRLVSSSWQRSCNSLRNSSMLPQIPCARLCASFDPSGIREGILCALLRSSRQHFFTAIHPQPTAQLPCAPTCALATEGMASIQQGGRM